MIMEEKNFNTKPDNVSNGNTNKVAGTEPKIIFGRQLAEKIRAKTDNKDFSDFEKYILDNGFKFKSKNALLAGYIRNLKCRGDILITEEEFILEAGEFYETKTLKAVYAALCVMVSEKKMKAGEVYRYARFSWCLRNPAAIIAYQESRDTWIVNNCATEVTEKEAKEYVNSEWGFEAGRIKIIGTAYYDATDYQFIRFDCGHMSWLWKNGSLYQVYE